MKRAMIALTVLAGTMLTTERGYSQYASFMGVPSVNYSNNIVGSGYMSNAPFYSSYSSYSNDVGITGGPIVQRNVTPQVIIINQGYGSFVGGTGAGSVSSGASVLYFPTYQPYIPSAFIGIYSSRPWAVYTRYSPF